MRCVCCNSNLSDYESTMKHPVTGVYLDICEKCLPDTGIKPRTRRDLEQEEFDDADDYIDYMLTDEEFYLEEEDDE